MHLTLPWLPPLPDKLSGKNSKNPWHQALQGALTDSPLILLLQLRNCFAKNTSRRAAYLTQGWLENLATDESLQPLLAANLRHQLQRQGDETSAALGPQLAALVCAVAHQQNSSATALVRDTLAVAEFLAREGRTLGDRS